MNQEIYIVTGANGHLGNTIVRKLLDQGKTVRGLTVPGDHSVKWDDPRLTLVEGDVLSPHALSPLFENADGADLIVIHTAGIVSIASRYQQKVWDVNVTGTQNIIDLCRKHHVKKLVHVSSVHALPEKKKGQVITEVGYFDPRLVKGLYARTKAAATQLVLNAAKEGLNASVVHPSGIIGPNDFGHGHLTQLILDYLDGRLTACVNGGYDFVDVRDVADGVLACVQRGRKGECYILSNRYYPVTDLLRTLHEITGRKEIKTVLPTWFAKATAPLAEGWYKMLKQPPLYTSYSLYTLESNALFSHEKATQELGYIPRPLRETLLDTVQWMDQNHRLKHAVRWAKAAKTL